MSEVGQKIIAGLRELVEDLHEGKVLSKYRVTKVVKEEDGSIKQVISDPKTGITVRRDYLK